MAHHSPRPVIALDDGASLAGNECIDSMVTRSIGDRRRCRSRFTLRHPDVAARTLAARDRPRSHVAGKRAADEVVFGQPGDLVLLGSRTLEGLNFRVEPVTKQLVDAGPAPAAVVG